MHFFSLAATSNIFLLSYQTSDFFGKLIFLALFAISIATWFVLIKKLLELYRIKESTAAYFTLLQKEKSRILNLQIQEPKSSKHPLVAIYASIKSKTLEILEKNHFFSSQNHKAENQGTFLSNSDLEHIEANLQTTLTQQMKSLEKNLFILPMTVSLAPFLGILGTVWGILISLTELQKGGFQSQSIILSGLSTALATTVLGLLIAVPALIAYNYLKNAIKSASIDMQDFSNLMLSTIEMQYRKVELGGI